MKTLYSLSKNFLHIKLFVFFWIKKSFVLYSCKSNCFDSHDTMYNAYLFMTNTSSDTCLAILSVLSRQNNSVNIQ